MFTNLGGQAPYITGLYSMQ